YDELQSCILERYYYKMNSEGHFLSNNCVFKIGPWYEWKYAECTSCKGTVFEDTQIYVEIIDRRINAVIEKRLHSSAKTSRPRKPAPNTSPFEQFKRVRGCY